MKNEKYWLRFSNLRKDARLFSGYAQQTYCWELGRTTAGNWAKALVSGSYFSADILLGTGQNNL